MQYLHHLNINKANKTPVSDCNSINPNATSVNDLTSVRYNNNTSSIIPQYYFKKPLEYQGSRTILTWQCKVQTVLKRQSSRTKSRRYCNINTLLKRQVISTTPIRYATIITQSKSINAAPSHQFCFNIGWRIWDQQLRLKVGRMSGINSGIAIIFEWNQSEHILTFLWT